MEQTLHSLIAMIAAKHQTQKCRRTASQEEKGVKAALTRRVVDLKRKRLKQSQHMLILGESARISRFKQKTT